MSESTYQSEEFVNRLKDSFDEMVLYKDLKKSNFIALFFIIHFLARRPELLPFAEPFLLGQKLLQ